MKVLIGNTVKTDNGDYPCATREEAEALFMTLKDPAESPAADRGPGSGKPAAAPGKKKG